MSSLRFSWDERKARENVAKHGVSFEEARTVFADEHGLVLDDPDHSAEEERFVLLGLSSGLRILMVSHCVREEGDLIRIISSRRATRNEQAAYVRWRRR
jgi:uncharacterized DUF497 family protein